MLQACDHLTRLELTITEKYKNLELFTNNLITFFNSHPQLHHIKLTRLDPIATLCDKEIPLLHNTIDCITSHKSLQTLDLSPIINIATDTNATLWQLLAHKKKSAGRVLKISGHDLAGIEKAMKTIADTNSPLCFEHIDLSGSYIPPSAVTALSEALAKKGVKSLRLSHYEHKSPYLVTQETLSSMKIITTNIQPIDLLPLDWQEQKISTLLTNFIKEGKTPTEQEQCLFAGCLLVNFLSDIDTPSVMTRFNPYSTNHPAAMQLYQRLLALPFTPRKKVKKQLASLMGKTLARLAYEHKPEHSGTSDTIVEFFAACHKPLAEQYFSLDQTPYQLTMLISHIQYMLDLGRLTFRRHTHTLHFDLPERARWSGQAFKALCKLTQQLQPKHLIINTSFLTFISKDKKNTTKFLSLLKRLKHVTTLDLVVNNEAPLTFADSFLPPNPFQYLPSLKTIQLRAKHTPMLFQTEHPGLLTTDNTSTWMHLFKNSTIKTIDLRFLSLGSQPSSPEDSSCGKYDYELLKTLKSCSPNIQNTHMYSHHAPPLPTELKKQIKDHVKQALATYLRIGEPNDTERLNTASQFATANDEISHNILKQNTPISQALRSMKIPFNQETVELITYEYVRSLATLIYKRIESREFENQPVSLKMLYVIGAILSGDGEILPSSTLGTPVSRRILELAEITLKNEKTKKPLVLYASKDSSLNTVSERELAYIQNLPFSHLCFSDQLLFQQGENQISTIEFFRTVLGNSKSMKTIELSLTGETPDVKAPEISARILTEVLQSNPSIETFHVIRDTYVSPSIEQLNAITKAISNAPNITQLSIFNLHTIPSNFKATCLALSELLSLKNLTHITLLNSDYPPLKLLIPATSKQLITPHQRTLQLHSPDDNLYSLSEITQLPGFDHLVISYEPPQGTNQLKTPNGGSFIPELGKLIGATKVTVLTLSNACLQNTMNHLNYLEPHLSALTILNLTHNQLFKKNHTHTTELYLKLIIHHCPSLTTLNLNSNNFSDLNKKTKERFDDILTLLSKLKISSLLLADNGIASLNEDRIKALFNALTASQLQNIDLRGNDLLNKHNGSCTQLFVDLHNWERFFKIKGEKPKEAPSLKALCAREISLNRYSLFPSIPSQDHEQFGQSPRKSPRLK